MFSVLPDGQTIMEKLFSARKLELVKRCKKYVFNISLFLLLWRSLPV